MINYNWRIYYVLYFNKMLNLFYFDVTMNFT